MLIVDERVSIFARADALRDPRSTCTVCGHDDHFRPEAGINRGCPCCTHANCWDAGAAAKLLPDEGKLADGD